MKNFKRLVCAVTALTMCLAFAGCQDKIPEDENPGGNGEASSWQDNMHRDDNDFLQDDNRRPSREPFVDDTPLEEEDAVLTPVRFEAENAKISGNSGGLDHFCTGKSIEFSPGFSGNVAMCNLGSVTLSYTFNSSKKVRSTLVVRLSDQGEGGGSIATFANMTVNDKPVVDLGATFEEGTGEVASGCSSLYFTMYTVETKISLAEGRNVLNITPASSNYLNLDYVEIRTSATIEDNTVSTLSDAQSFVNVTKAPTEASTGTLAWDCHATGVKDMADGECKNKAQRARTLPALTDKIYTKTDTDDGSKWTVHMFNEDVTVASSMAYMLTLEGGVTFEDGETSKRIAVNTKPALKVEVPDGMALVGWEDGEGNEYPVAFVMPDHAVTLKPKFVSADVTVTLQDGTLNGSSAIKAAMGGEIDLSTAEYTGTAPEGKTLCGWSVSDDRAKVYSAKYTVTGDVTLVPVFDSDDNYSASKHTGKIAPTGRVYGGKEKDCYATIENYSSGAIKLADGTYEKASIYRFKGGTAAAPAKMPAGAYFVTQEMNTVGKDTAAKTITVTVENFGTEDVTIRFALTTSSGSPDGGVYGEKTVTIKAGECITFTYDTEKMHDSIMNFITVQNEVEELFIGMCQYVSDKAA